MSISDAVRFLPELILILAGTLVMVLEVLTHRKSPLAALSFAALAAAIAASAYAQTSPGPAFYNMLRVDGFATFFRVVVMAVGMLTVLSADRFLAREGANSGEFYALVLFSVAGQSMMAASNELIILFIGLEVSSISSYVLAGFLRDDTRANESALKYFLLGSFATAFLLYGVALVYGVTGSTHLAEIAGKIKPDSLLGGLAAALLFIGFGFKISGAPFQMWAPDVYQGAPTPVSAFLSAGPKAAAFAAFLRVFTVAFGAIGERWEPLIWMAALLSMTIGNFGALTQTNVKRMLAYSSIAHAGYVLVAVAARSETGTAAVMFYLAAYALMNVGAFTIVGHVAGKGDRYVRIEDLSGLAARQPATAAMFSVFLLSFIGVPLTAGFFGKFQIFKAALESDLVWLAILGLLNSAVAAYYYLRLLVVMYMQPPGESMETLEPLPITLRLALFASAAGTLILGIYPKLVLEAATRSALLK